jgi:hypothetical protein
VVPAASSKKLKLFTAAAAALLCSYSNLLILSHLIKCLQTHNPCVSQCLLIKAAYEILLEAQMLNGVHMLMIP